MKLNIKPLLTFVIVLFSLKTIAANEIDYIYNFALTLETNKAESQAALEYKRFIYFEDKPGPKTLHAQSFLRDYYTSNNDIQHGKKFARLASQTAEAINAQNKDEIFIKEIEIISKETAKTNQEPILLTYTFDAYSKKVNKAAWSKLICNNLKLQNFDLAKSHFEISAQKNVFTKDEISQIENAFAELFSCGPKNPKLALFLSFIPGLGQCYAHNFKDGLNAFLINGSLIGLSTWSIATANYADFFYFEFSPLYSFYRGNLYNAQKDTFDYNDKLFEEKYKIILKICDSSY